jgi:hypothetical protein
MKKHERKTRSLKATLLMAAAATLPMAGGTAAWADDTMVPPQNGAGYGGTVVDPRVDIRHGDLEVDPSLKRVTIGGGTDSQGRAVGSFGLDLEKWKMYGRTNANDVYVGSNNRVYGFLVNPGIHLRVDFVAESGGGFKRGRTDLELSGIAAFRLRAGSRDGFTQRVIGLEEAAAAMKSGNSQVTQVGEIACASVASQALARTHCLDGLPSDLSMAIWSDEQKAEFGRRTVPIYQVRNQPSNAYEVVVLQVTGVYRDHPEISLSQEGARVTALSLAGETALDIAGARIDLSGQASAGGLVWKAVDQDASTTASFEARAQAGVGVQAGDLGRIGLGVDVESQMLQQGQVMTDISPSLTVSRLLGTPLTIGTTYETEKLGAKAAKTSLITVGGTW